jgi:methionine aminotransferase
MSKKATYSKLVNSGKTIFAIMSELAQQHKAIDLSRGYPDFNPDQALIDLYCKQLNSSKNQYAPVDGLFELREQIALRMQELYQANFNPETEITITNGATDALFASITALVRDGDEVIIIEPAYDSYAPAVRLSGGIPVFVEMNMPGYSLNWENVQKSLSGNTRMIIFNNPHNPTGTVFSALDIERLKKVVLGTDIYILSDEVYEHIVFDDGAHESLALHPKIKDQTIIVNSFGKTYHATGWRLGYILAPEHLTAEIRKTHQYSMYTVNTPVQHAFAEYLKTEKKYLEVKQLYQEKRDLLLKGLQGSRFKFKATAGTYFQCIDYSEISDEKDMEFASRLVREFGLATIPLSYFYKAKSDYKVLRLCFAKHPDTLNKALEVLHRFG